MSPGLAPRTAAWRVLHDLRRGVRFDQALNRALGGLSENDRSLAHELAAGVLRHRTALDQALTPQLTGGTARVRDDLLDILRLGAYQLLYLDRVPRHAAVDTAVTLGRRFGGARVGGFINAVLRKVAEQRDRGAEGQRVRAEPGANASELAALHSHPEWLVSRWVDRFGEDETEGLLRANNRRPPLVLQPARWSEGAVISSLDAAGIHWSPAPFGAGLVVAGVRPRDLPGYATGAWYVQDPSQALVIRYGSLPRGELIYDACAAPGGKALALSGPGAGLVLAADLRPARTRRLRENLNRAASGPFLVVAADARFPPIRRCDASLLDVPCSGTGVLARNPDARWRLTAPGLAAMAAQAAVMLRAVAAVIRKGGLLVFATCSLEPEENEMQVAAFLEEERFRREPPLDAVPAELLTAAGDLFLLPHRHGTDGAYAARLRKVGD